MRWPRIIILLVLALIVGAFAHYTLPQREIVRITDTDIIRTDFSGINRMFYAQGDTGSAVTDNRDLRIINTVRANGRDLVFRNEDTGFGWPPYFKLDSADLHAEASRLAREASGQWFAITHYGWRSNVLSIYPNAVSITPLEGPDVRLFPWLNIVILLVLAALIFMAWRIWERFEDRVIDPLRDRAAVTWAKLRDKASGRG